MFMITTIVIALACCAAGVACVAMYVCDDTEKI